MLALALRLGVLDRGLAWSGESIAGVNHEVTRTNLRRRSGVSSRGPGELVVALSPHVGVVVTGRLS
jgi:hypothetical protein